MQNINKGIKLVVSDLHFGTGLTNSDGSRNFFEEFYFDQKFVEFLDYYMSGEYKTMPVELVLNGDIFNFLQIDYKGHFVPVITESMTLNMLSRILEGHPEVFSALKHFAAQEGKTITYIVGNHDQGMIWPLVQVKLNEALETEVKYCQLLYYFDGVHIEHGHMYESVNRMNPKKFFLRQGLPEPILNLPFGSHFFINFVLKLKQKHPHLDKVRPFSRMVRWALINEPVMLFKGFAQVLGYFAKNLLRRKSYKSAWSFRILLKVFLENAIFPDLSDSARKILKDDRVHTVIFGHSHIYQHRQWCGGKDYFNTGTWTNIVSLDLSSLGKVTKLTYVYIDNLSTRPSGRLKEWKGYHRIEEDVVVS